MRSLLKHGVEDLPRLLGIAVGEQLHRALQVGEEDGHLLPLALERALGRENLLGEGAWGCRPRERRSAAAGWKAAADPESGVRHTSRRRRTPRGCPNRRMGRGPRACFRNGHKRPSQEDCRSCTADSAWPSARRLARGLCVHFARGTSSAAFREKNPLGTSLKPPRCTDITGQSSGRGAWVMPIVYQSTMS